jgi:hypothetical protein
VRDQPPLGPFERQHAVRRRDDQVVIRQRQMRATDGHDLRAAPDLSLDPEGKSADAAATADDQARPRRMKRRSPSATPTQLVERAARVRDPAGEILARNAVKNLAGRRIALSPRPYVRRSSFWSRRASPEGGRQVSRRFQQDHRLRGIATTGRGSLPRLLGRRPDRARQKRRASRRRPFHCPA